jgi:hypothetical protein
MVQVRVRHENGKQIPIGTVGQTRHRWQRNDVAKFSRQRPTDVQHQPRTAVLNFHARSADFPATTMNPDLHSLDNSLNDLMKKSSRGGLTEMTHEPVGRTRQ